MDENSQKKDNSNPLFSGLKINIDPKMQEELNKPVSDPEGISKEDMDFLQKVMELIENETINLLNPTTLINYKVYDALTEELKGKADINSLVILSTLRDIKTLWDLNEKDTYQIKNLVHKVRVTKERLENDIGDVYII